MEWRFYRQSGREKSVFGSLTSEFGDRLKTILWEGNKYNKDWVQVCGLSC